MATRVNNLPHSGDRVVILTPEQKGQIGLVLFIEEDYGYRPSGKEPFSCRLFVSIGGTTGYYKSYRPWELGIPKK